MTLHCQEYEMLQHKIIKWRSSGNQHAVGSFKKKPHVPQLSINSFKESAPNLVFSNQEIFPSIPSRARRKSINQATKFIKQQAHCGPELGAVCSLTQAIQKPRSAGSMHPFSSPTSFILHTQAVQRPLRETPVLASPTPFSTQEPSAPSPRVGWCTRS